MNRRTIALRQVALPVCGLVFSLIDPGDHGIWELSGPQRPHVLLHVAATGPNLLEAAYTIPGTWQDTALAVGHMPDGLRPATVRFTSSNLRWRSEATTVLTVVSDTLWIAEATGNFDLVVVVADGEAGQQHVIRLRQLH